MGLQDKLTKEGSQLSAANGGPIKKNPLATRESKLHTDGDKPGYSITGAGAQIVNKDFQEYRDGANNILPPPSLLDLEGKTPSKYLDNPPK